jgi:hypothetical protein
LIHSADKGALDVLANINRTSSLPMLKNGQLSSPSTTGVEHLLPINY